MKKSSKYAGAVLILNVFSLFLFMARKVLHYFVIEQENEESLLYAYLHTFASSDLKPSACVFTPICPKQNK